MACKMASWHMILGLLVLILLSIFSAREFAGGEGGYTKKDRTLFQSDRGKVLITGTGRSGTTFLIQLLTFLDLDTGYHRETYSKHVFGISGSGMERPISAPHKFLKSPFYIETLGQDMKDFLRMNTSIQAVIMPIRDYTESAVSRFRLGNGGKGGLWKASDVPSQENMYYKIMAEYLLSMVVYDINTIFIDYNRMVSDPVYLYTKVRQVLPHNISVEKFTDAFQEASEVNERSKEKRKSEEN